jgi:transposase-like protein
MDCKQCNSPHTIKYGQGRNHAQRYFCHTCERTFTPQGIRGTYSPSFIENINDLYCHQHKTAKEIIKKF